MRKKEIIFAVAILVSSLIFPGCTRPVPEGEGLEIGSPAPAFKLPDLNGREVSLDQYKGKLVLLDFWATWCGPCRKTMPVIENIQKEYRGNVVLLAVNLQESRDEVRKYVREYNINSQVLLDEEGSVGQIYGARAIPMYVLIDKAGIVRNVELGLNPVQLRAQIQRLL